MQFILALVSIKVGSCVLGYIIIDIIREIVLLIVLYTVWYLFVRMSMCLYLGIYLICIYLGYKSYTTNEIQSPY